MSREVTGDAPRTGATATDLEADLDDEHPEEEPAPPARAPGRPRLLVAGLVAAVAGLAIAATVVGGLPQTDARPAPTPTPTQPAPTTPALLRDEAAALPVDVGLWARVVPDGRESGDWTHVRAKVSLMNMGGVPRRIGDISLVGLGAASVEAPGEEIPPQTSIDVPATIEADCAALTSPGPVVVRITEYDRSGRDIDVRANSFRADPDPRDVLRPLCPPATPGLRIAVATSGGGSSSTDFVVRVVNHGNLSGLVTPRAGPDAGDLRLVSSPALPYDLGPGEAVVATLELRAAPGTKGCPDGTARQAAQALFLEAETPYGFTEVTGFPVALVEGLVRQRMAAAGCPGA